MKDIHIGAHINTRSLVFTNPIAIYITICFCILLQDVLIYVLNALLIGIAILEFMIAIFIVSESLPPLVQQ